MMGIILTSYKILCIDIILNAQDHSIVQIS